MIQFLNRKGNGIDTSDATAQSNDIISEKTAYVKNTKIIGNIKLNNKSSEDVSTTTFTISDDSIITKSDITKTLSIYNKTPIRQAYENNSYVGTGCSYDNLANYLELTPEKLVQGNSILGVEGTASTGGFDTSQIRQCDYMFAKNTDITEAPFFDTSNVVSMSHMFNSCTNLQTIPLLDTNKVTDMSNMFSSCTNLTTIPQLDTSSVTNMDSMFSFCVMLIEIPLLNTSNVTQMINAFSSCFVLSEESLINILEMCINAVKITSNKTLKNIGLSKFSAETCKTLSNYQAFLDAGWTTGY